MSHTAPTLTALAEGSGLEVAACECQRGAVKLCNLCKWVRVLVEAGFLREDRRASCGSGRLLAAGACACRCD